MDTFRAQMTEAELVEAMKGRNTVMVEVHNSDIDVPITRDTALEMRSALRGYIKIVEVGDSSLVIQAT